MATPLLALATIQIAAKFVTVVLHIAMIYVLGFIRCHSELLIVDGCASLAMFLF